MTSVSSYQPFLIGEGRQKSGLFTYLDSWIKPEDAYDEMINAFIYKGSIYQRPGMTPYFSNAGNGGLVYLDTIQIGTGTGSEPEFTFTLPNFPVVQSIVHPTIIISTVVLGAVVHAIDNGTTFTPPWTIASQNNLVNSVGTPLDETEQNT